MFLSTSPSNGNETTQDLKNFTEKPKKGFKIIIYSVSFIYLSFTLATLRKQQQQQ